MVSGNPEHIRQLMDALNQGGDQRGGNAMAPVTAESAVHPGARVHGTVRFDLPAGTEPGRVKSLMEELYKLKDRAGKVLLTGFTRVGDRIMIGSHFYTGDNFTAGVDARDAAITRILAAHSIPGYDISPYEVLSYERTEAPAADPNADPSAGPSAGPADQQVAGPAGGRGAPEGQEDGQRNLGDAFGHPLATRFRRYYDSVLEGLGGPAAEKVTAPAAEAPAAEAPAPAPAPAADPALEQPTLAEQNRAHQQDFSDALAEFRAARSPLWRFRQCVELLSH